MSATAWTEFRADLVAAVNAGTADQFGRRTWTSAQIQHRQADDLRRLITYAAEHSPFHRRRLEKLRLDDLHGNVNLTWPHWDGLIWPRLLWGAGCFGRG